MRLVFSNGNVAKKHRWKTEKIPVANLSQILLHYHAAVGFVCAWEFNSKSGKSFIAEANDIDKKLLSKLEYQLPNFSSNQFYEQFKYGDFEDVILGWSAI